LTVVNSRNIQVVHLEPTDVCQAACPQCARETDPLFDRRQQHHLTIEDICRVLPMDIIQCLHKVLMCGVYGDPAAARHSFEIYQWLRQQNPNIVLGMNTNGALRSSQWWERLAKLFNQPQDYVVFSIDGLEDTNHLYRRGVEWNKLIANARSFIEAGGSAHWDMLIFDHNQHQVDLCEQLAKTMGFKWFRTKISKRPSIDFIKPPHGWVQETYTHTTNISCHAQSEMSIYIDAQGKISPCCWLGGRKDNDIQDLSQVEASWKTDTPYPICAKNCNIVWHKTQFQSQWQKEVAF
jgi:MoaA/NifB/PqqE/SkfB family radical SAM enzyme